MKHENAEVEYVLQRLIEAVKRGSQNGYLPSDEAIRSQIVYVYQLGRFDGRIAGIKEMSDLAR